MLVEKNEMKTKWQHVQYIFQTETPQRQQHAQGSLRWIAWAFIAFPITKPKPEGRHVNKQHCWLHPETRCLLSGGHNTLLCNSLHTYARYQNKKKKITQEYFYISNSLRQKSGEKHHSAVKQKKHISLPLMKTHSALYRVTLLVFMLAPSTVIKMRLHGVYDPLSFSLSAPPPQFHNKTNVSDLIVLSLNFSPHDARPENQ